MSDRFGVSAARASVTTTLQEPIGPGPSYLAPTINNLQPSLTIEQTVVLYGIFPSRETGAPGGAVSIAYVLQFACTFAPRDTAEASGQFLSISQNTALFSILGTQYGGNGMTNFQLPDLREDLAVGAGMGNGLTSHTIGESFGIDFICLEAADLPTDFGGAGMPVGNSETSLAINYVIHTGNGTGANVAGMVYGFLGNFDPSGALICDGRTLAIADYPTLFATIGTIYGGDGITSFRIPDLRGRTIIGTDSEHPVGSIVGSEFLDLSGDTLPTDVGGDGDAIGNLQPGVAMQVLIATQGIFPSHNQEGSPPQIEGGTPILSQIVYFAGTGRPAGFVPAQGQILSISENDALFSLIGTLYGGDGMTTFALPDFRGRASTHVGSSTFVGAVQGSDEVVLTINDIPGRNQDGTTGNDTLLGSNGNDVFHAQNGYDVLVGNGGNDWLYGGPDNDRLEGGSGIDRLLGGLGADLMIGGTGNDIYADVDAGDTVTELVGGGRDTVTTQISLTLADFVENLVIIGSGAVDGTGNIQNNRLTGNGSDNILRGLGASDQLLGAGGNDTLYGDGGNDTLQGGGGDDALWGGGNDDDMEGGSGNDALTGQSGRDTLAGGEGNDTLEGGDGDDTLLGGVGRDVATGGTGADRFVFTDGDLLAPIQPVDLIIDFTMGEGDILDLASIDAIATTGANDDFTFIGSLAFSGTAGELRAVQKTALGYTLVTGDTNGDGVADFGIRLDGLITLTVSSIAGAGSAAATVPVKKLTAPTAAPELSWNHVADGPHAFPFDRPDHSQREFADAFGLPG